MPQLLLSVALLGPLLIQQAPPPAPEPNGDSGGPSISEDGKWIVFESRASNFVPSDVKDTWDVFLYERESGMVTRVNQDTTSAARSPQISGDGRWIAFLQARPARPLTSKFVNWASTEHPWGVGLHDRQKGSIRWLGEAEPTYELDRKPRAASISQDGARMVYSAFADGVLGIRLYEAKGTELDVTELSVGSPGSQFEVLHPSISRSGRYLAFASSTRGLAPPAPLPPDLEVQFDFMGHETHVYCRDLETDTNTSVSDLAYLVIRHAEFSNPLVSDDGRIVAYDHNDLRLMGRTHAAFVTDLEKMEAERLFPVTHSNVWDGSITVTWLSSDGGQILVDSFSNLIPSYSPDGDAQQVLLREMSGSDWELVSRSADSSPGNRASWGGVASADLSVIAFASDATNLVARDSNRSSDVFVLERPSGRMTRIVPRSSQPEPPRILTSTQPNGHSRGPRISEDGQFIVFASQASNFDDQDSGDSWDVFLQTQATGDVRRLSSEPHGTVSAPALSGDGRWIAYWSRPDVDEFVSAPWTLRMLERPSGTWSSVEGLNPYMYGGTFLGLGPVMSYDGSRLAFQAEGPTRPDGSGTLVARLYDRKLGIPSIVSIDAAGRINDLPANSVTISGDGRQVAFSSQCTSLAPWPLSLEHGIMPGPNQSTIFVHDVEKRTTRAVSDLLALIGARGDCSHPHLSADGTHAAFNHHGNATVGFVANLESGSLHRILPATNLGVAQRDQVFIVWLSPDGQSVLVWSHGGSIPGAKATRFPQLFLHDLSKNTWTPISRSRAGEPANRPVQAAVATRDLSKIVFESEADNLVEGDTNNARDIFIADVATGRIRRIEKAGK